MMREHMPRLVWAAVVLFAAVVPVLAQDAGPLAVLQSDAGLEEKQNACIALSIHGGPEAVPVLEPLLLDAEMSHMARYVLEPMPFPEAGAALRNALAQASGDIKVGIMNSLANRGDTECVPALIAAMSDSEPLVAQEAARALGTIATAEASEALTAALAHAAPENRHAICEGILRCAERLAEQGRRPEAVGLYDLLRAESDVAREVRTAALRGAVMVRGPQAGLALLTEAVRTEDDALFIAALRTARELGGGDFVTAALAEELPALSDTRKIRLMQALAERGGDAAGPALLAEAGEGAEEIRIAAVNALTRIAYAPALDLIAQLACGDDAPLTDAARRALAYFPGEAGDAMLVAMLEEGEAHQRRVAVELIGRGGLPGPTEILMDTAESDADDEVRLIALRALRDRAGVPEMPRLLAMLRETDSEEELGGAEGALRAVVDRERRLGRAEIVIERALYGDVPDGVAANVTPKVISLVQAGETAITASNAHFGDPAPGVVKRLQIEYTIGDDTFTRTVLENETLELAASAIPPAIVDAFCDAFEQAKDDATPAAFALLRLMGATGSPAALEVVHATATEGDGELRQTAERLLCDWPTPDALPIVIEMARESSDATLRVLALRGAVRMLRDSDTPPDQRLEQLAVLMDNAATPDEKRQVLSGLGLIPHVGALDMIFEQFADEAVRAEAEQAAITIAERLGGNAQEDASIFNGQDLTGWSSPHDYWRVEDGAIVGEATEQVPETTYLWSNVEVGDFYLVADVKLEPNTANSGIQFRSRKLNEAGHAFGYQGDMGQDVWGRLYHQGGRAKLDWTGRAEEAVKPGEWNRFEILAVGPAIWTAINGQLGVACLDLAGKDERTGLIAFQMHSGPTQKQSFRIEKLVHNPKVEIAGMGADALIPELTIPE